MYRERTIGRMPSFDEIRILRIVGVGAKENYYMPKYRDVREREWYVAAIPESTLPA